MARLSAQPPADQLDALRVETSDMSVETDLGSEWPITEAELQAIERLLSEEIESILKHATPPGRTRSPA